MGLLLALVVPTFAHKPLRYLTLIRPIPEAVYPATESVEPPALSNVACDLVVENSDLHWQHDYAGLWAPLHREIRSLRVRVTNTGTTTWHCPGTVEKHALGQFSQGSVVLSYRLYNEAGQLVQDGLDWTLRRCRAAIEGTLEPGDSQSLEIWLPLPAAGHYRLDIGLAQLGHAWFDQLGGQNAQVALTVGECKRGGGSVRAE